MDFKNYVKLIPLLEKTYSDLQVAAKTPEDQALLSDFLSLLTDIKGAV